MRVVSIVSRMNVGGPAVLLKHLIDGLVLDGVEHILITGTCLPNEIDFLETNTVGGEVIRLEKISRSVGIIKEISSFIRLVRILQRLKPDVVHTHMSKAGLLGRLATKFASPKTKIVHTYHGHLLYGYFGSIRTKTIINIEKFLALITDKLVAVTNQVHLDLAKVKVGKEEKWLVIPPGIPAMNRQPKSQSRIALNLPNQKNLIAWIGRFEEVKDPLLAIKSFQCSIASNPNFRLVMAGDGELLEQCKSYSEKYDLDVSFLGWVSDVSHLLNATDFLLMTSRNEGMPIVILEAASIGKPTIATNVGGVADFIVSEFNGILTSRSKREISQAILKCSDVNYLDALARNSETTFNQRFSVKRFILDHEIMYRDLIQTH